MNKKLRFSLLMLLMAVFSGVWAQNVLTSTIDMTTGTNGASLNGVTVEAEFGTLTYGKGTAQNSQSLSTGSSIKYTTDKWLTSKGKWLNEKGVKPDVEVSLNEEYYSDPKIETDNQIQQSIIVLKESNFE